MKHSNNSEIRRLNADKAILISALKATIAELKTIYEFDTQVSFDVVNEAETIVKRLSQ